MKNALVIALSVAAACACSLRSLDHLAVEEGSRAGGAGAFGGATGGVVAQGGSRAKGELPTTRLPAHAGAGGAAEGGTGASDGGAPAGAGGGAAPAGGGGAATSGSAGSLQGDGGNSAASGSGGVSEGGSGGTTAGAAGGPGGAAGAAGSTGDGCTAGEPCPLRHETAYQLVPGHNLDACVDIRARSFDGGAPAIQYDNVQQSNQVFWAEARSGGAFSFRSANSGKCLEVSDASLEADAPIRQATCTGEAHQRWRPAAVSEGLYRLVAEHSGLVLDVDGAEPQDNGELVVQNPARNLADTMWQLREVTQGAYVALRESPSSEARLRHLGADVSVDATTASDGEWKVVSGLADAACVSFESRDQPGSFLRLANGLVACEPLEESDAFSGDATFCLREPLQAGGWSYRSIRPFRTPDDYLLRDAGRVVSAVPEDTEAFALASSWSIREP